MKHVRSALCKTPARRFLITDIAEVASEHRQMPDITDYRPLLGEKTFTYEPDRHSFLSHSERFGGFEYRSPERFVCTVSNASLHMQSGAVCTSSGSLLAESALERERMQISPAFRSFRPAWRNRLHGKYTTIWGLWGEQFYHWWIDCLPRIQSLVSTNVLPRTPLLIPAHLGNFQRESLAACLPPETKIVEVEDQGWIDLDQLVLPSFLTWKSCGLIPSTHRDYLRERLFKYAGVKAPVSHRRLYISRSKVGRRQLLNESAVETFLTERGFETCHPEQLSLAEQVRLFSEAEIIVAAHGSALVNLLYGSKVRLLELFPNQDPATHFFFLCQSLGHEYHYLLGDAPEHHDDFRVDMQRFEQAFKEMAVL